MVFIPVQDDNPLRSIRRAWVTLVLIGLNVAAFLAAAGIDYRQIASFAIVPYELIGGGVAGGAARGGGVAIAVPEYTTLLSYMFLHADLLHLSSNLLFLWVFGDNVEDAMGHGRFLGFYLLCGVAAGLAHAAMLPASTVPLIGASGAVAGIVAAYLLLHPRVRVWVLAFRFIPLRIPAWAALGSWVGIQVLMVAAPMPGSQTAWWAHLGGIAAGALLVLVLRRPGVSLFDRDLADRALASGGK